MRYWMRFPLDDMELIQQELLAYAFTLPSVANGHFWTQLNAYLLTKAAPSVNRSLRKKGLFIMYAAMITVSKPRPTSVHIDDMFIANGVRARLNIPVLNTAGTITQFFTAPVHGRELRRTANGQRFWHIDQSTTTLVDQVEVTEPTILRISEPHDVVTPPSNLFPRIVLSLQLNIDPVRYLDGAL